MQRGVFQLQLDTTSLRRSSWDPSNVTALTLPARCCARRRRQKWVERRLPSTGQTGGRTTDRCINPAPPTTRAASICCLRSLRTFPNSVKVKVKVHAHWALRYPVQSCVLWLIGRHLQQPVHDSRPEESHSRSRSGRWSVLGGRTGARARRRCRSDSHSTCWSVSGTSIVGLQYGGVASYNKSIGISTYRRLSAFKTWQITLFFWFRVVDSSVSVFQRTLK